MPFSPSYPPVVVAGVAVLVRFCLQIQLERKVEQVSEIACVLSWVSNAGSRVCAKVVRTVNLSPACSFPLHQGILKGASVCRVGRKEAAEVIPLQVFPCCPVGWCRSLAVEVMK